MHYSRAARTIYVFAIFAIAASMEGAALADSPEVAIKLSSQTPLAGTLCPKTTTFQASITTSNWPATLSPKTLRYTWLRSDGATAPVQSLTYKPEGGTALVETTWSLSQTYNGWQAIQVVSPISYTSPHVQFAVVCPNSPAPRVIPTDPASGTADALITTKIHLTSPPDQQACPKTLSFDGTLTVSNLAPGAVKEVTYKWIRSDGASGPVMTSPLGPGGGAVHVSETWELGRTYTGWEALQVFYPHAYESHHHDFTLECLEAPPRH